MSAPVERKKIQRTNAPHAFSGIFASWRPARRRYHSSFSCAAQKRDEVAPLHCLMLPVLSTERIAHLATAQGRCAAAFQFSLCRRWGHSRPIDTAIAVAACRFTPRSD